MYHRRRCIPYSIGRINTGRSTNWETWLANYCLGTNKVLAFISYPVDTRLTCGCEKVRGRQLLLSCSARAPEAIPDELQRVNQKTGGRLVWEGGI